MKSQLDNLVLEFKQITKQTKNNAEKLLFEIIKDHKEKKLQEFLTMLENTLTECPTCFYLMENRYCESCMSKKRDQNKICVVSDIVDAKAIIDKDVFDGTFHILKGEIDLKKNIGPDNLTIEPLIQRIVDQNCEVIIALNATFKGELTANYLIQELKSKGKKVSKLARGIPFGGVVNYIDKETIENAIKNRDKL